MTSDVRVYSSYSACSEMRQLPDSNSWSRIAFSPSHLGRRSRWSGRTCGPRWATHGSAMGDIELTVSLLRLPQHFLEYFNGSSLIAPIEAGAVHSDPTEGLVQAVMLLKDIAIRVCTRR